MVEPGTWYRINIQHKLIMLTVMMMVYLYMVKSQYLNQSTKAFQQVFFFFFLSFFFFFY